MRPGPRYDLRGPRLRVGTFVRLPADAGVWRVAFVNECRAHLVACGRQETVDVAPTSLLPTVERLAILQETDMANAQSPTDRIIDRLNDVGRRLINEQADVVAKLASTAAQLNTIGLSFEELGQAITDGAYDAILTILEKGAPRTPPAPATPPPVTKPAAAAKPGTTLGSPINPPAKTGGVVVFDDLQHAQLRIPRVGTFAISGFGQLGSTGPWATIVVPKTATAKLPGIRHAISARDHAKLVASWKTDEPRRLINETCRQEAEQWQAPGAWR